MTHLYRGDEPPGFDLILAERAITVMAEVDST
jgi:hypothetical protein